MSWNPTNIGTYSWPLALRPALCNIPVHIHFHHSRGIDEISFGIPLHYIFPCAFVLFLCSLCCIVISLNVCVRVVTIFGLPTVSLRCVMFWPRNRRAGRVWSARSGGFLIQKTAAHGPKNRRAGHVWSAMVLLHKTFRAGRVWSPRMACLVTGMFG